jgi:hypothetical protein
MPLMLPILLVIATVKAIAKRHKARRVRAVEGPTREYDVVDLDALGARQLRQIHGLTATELATERAAAERDERWEWARIEADLSCDADFRLIATRLEDLFPTT